jgi:ribosomal protein S18 acetylase RimI-like enzyme
MESMLASLVKQGVKQVWLEVKIGNEEGVRLYARLGFAHESVVVRYYSDGSDALRMRKVLVS